MTWPFENDTSAVVTRLAKRNLKSEKRRNLMVVVAVALAAFLICFTAVFAVSIAQLQRGQVTDSYEAVFTGIETSDMTALKELPELARGQMKLTEGRLPERANEIAVSKYFLTAYGSNAKIGEIVRLDTESFYGDYTVTGVLSGIGEQEANTCVFVVSKAPLSEQSRPWHWQAAM